MISKKGRLAIGLVALLVQTAMQAAEIKRWYSHEMIETGATLFASKCSRCHGIDAEGNPDWRELTDDGLFPPPPLDGTAYTWRHDLERLREQIRKGGQGKSEMPAFAKKLKQTEIDTLIAYIQSHWNDEIYQAWYARQLKEAARPKNSTVDGLYHAGNFWLKRYLSPANLIPGEPRKTPVAGISEVRVDDRVLYLSEDGRYAFTGHMIDLVDGSDLTEDNARIETVGMIESFPVDQMLVFPAAGKENNHLTVFTDTSCGYCRKFHREVSDLTEQGITVRYIPYPRRGLQGRGGKTLQSIWCSDNPPQSLHRYFADDELRQPRVPGCISRAVERGYRLGNQIGIRGTPLIVLGNGTKIRGYKSAEEILDLLQER